MLLYLNINLQCLKLCFVHGCSCQFMGTGRASKSPIAFLSCLIPCENHVSRFYFFRHRVRSLDFLLSLCQRSPPFYPVYTINWFGLRHQRQEKRSTVNSLVVWHLLHKLTWVNPTDLARLEQTFCFLFPFVFPFPFFFPPVLGIHTPSLQICCDWEFSASGKKKS